MTTWEIHCYPLSGTRKDAEFFDEVTCDQDMATTLCQALFNAHQSENLWFFHKPKQGTEVVEHNWDLTGKYNTEDIEPEPVGDPLYDGLKSLLSVPKVGTLV